MSEECRLTATVHNLEQRIRELEADRAQYEAIRAAARGEASGGA